MWTKPSRSSTPRSERPREPVSAVIAGLVGVSVSLAGSFPHDGHKFVAEPESGVTVTLISRIDAGFDGIVDLADGTDILFDLTLESQADGSYAGVIQTWTAGATVGTGRCDFAAKAPWCAAVVIRPEGPAAVPLSWKMITFTDLGVVKP